jgi:hypothetical protein
MKKIIGNFGNIIDFHGDENLEIDPDSMLDESIIKSNKEENMECIQATDNGFLCTFHFETSDGSIKEITCILFEYKKIRLKQIYKFYVTKEMLLNLVPFDNKIILKKITFVNNNKVLYINSGITRFSYKFYGSLPLCVVEF